MHKYIHDLLELTKIGELRDLLEEICGESSYDKMAEYIGINKSTFYRMLSTERCSAMGPKVENVEKIVTVFCQLDKDYEMQIRDKVYGLLYSSKIKRDKLTEYADMVAEQSGVKETEAIKEEVVDIANVDSNDLVKEASEISPRISGSREYLLQKMKEVIIKVVDDMGAEILGSSISKRSDIGIIFDVSHEYSIVFGQPHIEMIYGIVLTEENYIKTINDVIELDTEDGLILLCCESLEVRDRAIREELLRGVNNNILLYSLSEHRKIYVTSVKKKEKKFLKYILGKENLMFPK